jgi:hypothetical protein
MNLERRMSALTSLRDYSVSDTLFWAGGNHDKERTEIQTGLWF